LVDIATPRAKAIPELKREQQQEQKTMVKVQEKTINPEPAHSDPQLGSCSSAGAVVAQPRA
jgi:hypothetical protein